jgi:hypothetical protein
LKQFEPTGDTTSQILNLNTKDTLLYVDSLLPNKSYSFIASHSGSSGISSNQLSVTTLDTTSHNFTFESWTFGTIGSSTLYDVAIISPENIWCVGEILVADTSINGYTTYNAVHWDGSQWELKRIRYFGSCSAVEYPPLKAIWAFSENDIVITNGGSIGWYNGNTVNLDCRVNPLLNGAINKIWGTNSEDLYVVGNNGAIVHYNGTLWSRIESGTELHIGDIWGIFDGNDGYNKYLAAVNTMLIINEYGNLQRVITEQGHTLSSVWGISEKLLYTAGGNGLSLYKNNKWEKINKPDVNTIYNVRGQGHNDVFGLSSTFNLLHFNGYSWQYINIGGSNIYYRQEVKNELTVVVGWQGDKAVITVIRRNQ